MKYFCQTTAIVSNVQTLFRSILFDDHKNGGGMLYSFSGVDDMIYTPDMDEAYRLRHDVFVEEKRWETLRRPDQRDIDQFERPENHHFILKINNKVIGYQRMLPTTLPHLLSHVMPQLCTRGKAPNGPNIYEWTRHCVHQAHRQSAGPNYGAQLTYALVKWGIRHSVEGVIVEYHPDWIKRFQKLGFHVERLGPEVMIHGEKLIAVYMTFDQHTLDMIEQQKNFSVQ
jgi:acyl-homoserine lactone synthase